MMEDSIVSVNVDLQKMPLGELSKETVIRGYSILRKLEDAIKAESRSEFTQLSSQFYTVIPHNFGMKRMDRLRDHKLINSIQNKS